MQPASPPSTEGLNAIAGGGGLFAAGIKDADGGTQSTAALGGFVDVRLTTLVGEFGLI